MCMLRLSQQLTLGRPEVQPPNQIFKGGDPVLFLHHNKQPLNSRMVPASSKHITSLILYRGLMMGSTMRIKFKQAATRRQALFGGIGRTKGAPTPKPRRRRWRYRPVQAA